ncbi:hypothetical protein FA13DRAFT_1736196, partial [Coprinellus micaceus]
MLTFFDIPFRYYLNYHRIYRTQWVELPHIERTCTSRGSPPSKVQPRSIAYPEGRKTYTLPTVYDPSTNTYVSESAWILKYLDGRYPSTTSARAFPKGTSVLQSAFLTAWATRHPALGCNHPRYRKDAARRESYILRGDAESRISRENTAC